MGADRVENLKLVSEALRGRNVIDHLGNTVSHLADLTLGGAFERIRRGAEDDDYIVAARNYHGAACVIGTDDPDRLRIGQELGLTLSQRWEERRVT